MPQSPDPGLEYLPRAAGMVARAACAAARKAGLPVEPLLRQANLTVAQMEDVRARVVARDQVRFVNIVADALDDDLFGFHLGRGVELRQAGLLYYVMASSQTILEASQRGARYWSLASEGMLQQCKAGRNLDLATHYVGTSRHLDRHHTECWAAVMVRVVRELSGERVVPLRVRFVHPRSKCPPQLAAYFGKLEFGAKADDIRFDGSVAGATVVGADSYLNRVLAGYCEEALAHHHPARGSFVSRTQNAIVPLLPHGEARAAAVASRLGLSERTFARRLAAEGATFSTVLDGLKSDLADRYLADDDRSISQVAWLLGYREVSAFSKAFKRWSGKSPRDARAVGAGAVIRRAGAA